MVDERLVVYGTGNLRVVDVSVVPIIMAGHVQTAAYGIAEVASGIIVAERFGDRVVGDTLMPGICVHFSWVKRYVLRS